MWAGCDSVTILYHLFVQLCMSASCKYNKYAVSDIAGFTSPPPIVSSGDSIKSVYHLYDTDRFYGRLVRYQNKLDYPSTYSGYRLSTFLFKDILLEMFNKRMY